MTLVPCSEKSLQAGHLPEKCERELDIALDNQCLYKKELLHSWAESAEKPDCAEGHGRERGLFFGVLAQDAPMSDAWLMDNVLGALSGQLRRKSSDCYHSMRMHL